MDKTKIETIIKELDKNLEYYADLFSNEKKDIDNQTKNNSKITYERTVSSISNIYLKNLISKQYKTKVDLFVNEYQIYLKNGLTTTSFAKMRGDLHLSYKDKKDKWCYCVVDGYFKFHFNSITKHLFVEYKLNDEFEYAQLALDFLKYKCYTKIDESNTFFAYAICKKQESYPSIIADEMRLYKEIDSSLSDSDLKKYSVFIYEGKSEKNMSLPSDVLINSLQEIKANMDLIGEKKSLLSDDERTILNGMCHYNSKVIKSNLLKNNIENIFSAYNYLMENEIFSKKALNEFKNSNNEFDIDKILEEGGNYNGNLAEIFGKESKITSAENGFRGSPYISLYMVTFVHYFCKIYAGEFENKWEFGTYSAGRGKNKEILSYEKTVENLEEKLFSFYPNKQIEHYKLSKLVFSLTYYLKTIFPLLYKLDENNRFVCENETILNDKSIKIIFELYKKISKMEDISVKKPNLKDFAFNYDEYLKLFFLELIKKY